MLRERFVVDHVVAVLRAAVIMSAFEVRALKVHPLMMSLIQLSGLFAAHGLEVDDVHLMSGNNDDSEGSLHRGWVAKVLSWQWF